MSPITYPIPLAVLRALRQLGQDISEARRRRRLPSAILAERASISRTTLGQIEKGNPGTAIGSYAAVLFALGLLDRLRLVASAGADEVGQALEAERLPKRIRLPRARDEP